MRSSSSSREDSCKRCSVELQHYVIRHLQSTCTLPLRVRLIFGVIQRIDYKIAMMTFNYIHGTCPVYFHDVCCPAAASVDARTTLRSAQPADLFEHRTNRYGPRSFRVSAAAVWNKLRSQHLRAEGISRELFARGLKTICARLLVGGALVNIRVANIGT